MSIPVDWIYYSNIVSRSFMLGDPDFRWIEAFRRNTSCSFQLWTELDYPAIESSIPTSCRPQIDWVRCACPAKMPWDKSVVEKDIARLSRFRDSLWLLPSGEHYKRMIQDGFFTWPCIASFRRIRVHVVSAALGTASDWLDDRNKIGFRATAYACQLPSLSVAYLNAPATHFSVFREAVSTSKLI